MGFARSQPRSDTRQYRPAFRWLHHP